MIQIFLGEEEISDPTEETGHEKAGHRAERLRLFEYGVKYHSNGD
jgi:hypothetical protein